MTILVLCCTVGSLFDVQCKIWSHWRNLHWQTFDSLCLKGVVCATMVQVMAETPNHKCKSLSVCQHLLEPSSLDHNRETYYCKSSNTVIKLWLERSLLIYTKCIYSFYLRISSEGIVHPKMKGIYWHMLLQTLITVFFKGIFSAIQWLWIGTGDVKL